MTPFKCFGLCLSHQIVLNSCKPGHKWTPNFGFFFLRFAITYQRRFCIRPSVVGCQTLHMSHAPLPPCLWSGSGSHDRAWARLKVELGLARGTLESSTSTLRGGTSSGACFQGPQGANRKCNAMQCNAMQCIALHFLDCKRHVGEGQNGFPLAVTTVMYRDSTHPHTSLPAPIWRCKVHFVRSFHVLAQDVLKLN